MSEKVRQEKINYYNNVSRDFLMGKLDDLGSILEDIAKKKYSKDAEVPRGEYQVYQGVVSANKTNREKLGCEAPDYNNNHLDGMKRLKKMRERAEKKEKIQ